MRFQRLLFALVLPVAMWGQSSPSVFSGPQILSSAASDVELKPDRASVVVGVESRGSTAAAASSETARKLRAVIDTLRALGISDDRALTSSMEIHPEYVGGGDGKPLRIGGYVAQSSIRVTILNIDRAGPVIDASLSKQASSVSSLEFSSSKQDDARRQALEMAVALARADADAMARAAGGAIGGLLELTAQPSYVAPIAVGFAQARSLSTQAAMPISPGIIRVSATVSARWSFVSRR